MNKDITGRNRCAWRGSASARSALKLPAQVLLLILLVFCTASRLTAQNATSGSPLIISPAEALQMASENSRELWYAGSILEQAETAFRSRYLRLLPDLKIGSSVASSQPDASAWKGSFAASASLSLEAEDLLLLSQSEAVARAAASDYRSTVTDFRAAVYTSYFKLILLKEEITLLERQVRSAADRLEAARFDFDNGRISEYEYLSAQLSYEETNPLAAGKRIEYSAALEQFRLLLGIDPDRQVELTGSLDFEPPLEKIIRQTEKEREDLSLTPRSAQLSADVRTAALSLKKVPLRFLPDLTLSLSRTYTNDIPPTSFESEEGGLYSLSITFTLNELLPGSQYRAARKTAGIQLENARRMYEESLDRQEADARELMARLEKAETDIEAARFKQDLSDRFYAIARDEYENGRRDLLELEEADLKRGEARLALLEAVYRKLSLLIELEQLTGLSLLE